MQTEHNARAVSATSQAPGDTVGTLCRFERFHDILIQAAPAEVLDYVSNPNSWPEWIAASHQIESPDRPLQQGETFRERWATRTGEFILEWVVTVRQHPLLWEAQTSTPFTGVIVVRYEIEPEDGACRYRRCVTNPARPKMPTGDMVERMDEEARVSLQNIKNNVEKRNGRALRAA